MNSSKAKARAAMVILGGFICIGMSSGVLISSMSMYLVPVAAKLGTNAGVVGYFFTFNAICSFMASLLAAPLLKKFGIKGTLTTGAIAAALGVLFMAWAPNAGIVCIAGFLTGACTCWASNPVMQPTVARWFMYNRGKFGALMGLGEWVGATIFAFIAATYINAGRYEFACIITAVCEIVLIMFAAFVLIRGYPEDAGLKPIGYDRYQAELAAAEISSNKKTEETDTMGLSKKEVFRRASFWIFMAANLFMVLSCTLYSPQQTTIYLAAGMTTVQAASLVSIYAAAKTINKLVYGVAADYLGVVFGSLYTIVLVVIGLIMFLTASSFQSLAIAAILVGSGQGLAGMSGTLGLSKLIGQKSIADLGVIPHGASAVGGILGPTIFGLIYSATGQLQFAIVLGMVSWIITGILIAVSLRNKNLVELDGLSARKIKVAIEDPCTHK